MSRKLLVLMSITHLLAKSFIIIVQLELIYCEMQKKLSIAGEMKELFCFRAVPLLSCCHLPKKGQEHWYHAGVGRLRVMMMYNNGDLFVIINIIKIEAVGWGENHKLAATNNISKQADSGALVPNSMCSSGTFNLCVALYNTPYLQ